MSPYVGTKVKFLGGKKERVKTNLKSYIRPINPKESPTVLMCVTKASFHKKSWREHSPSCPSMAIMNQ